MGIRRMPRGPTRRRLTLERAFGVSSARLQGL